MKTYIYYAMRNNQKISGVVKAPHSFQALHLAQREAFLRNATGRTILLSNTIN